MARTASIVKEQKKINTWKSLQVKRAELKNRLRLLQVNAQDNFAEIQTLVFKLQRLPRNSSATRITRRCKITGRARGVYRKVGLSRIKFRELAMRGEIPGVVKSSW